MRLKLKEVTEDSLAEFLLNPFEKSARFDGRIIQKYTARTHVDDIFLLYEKTDQYRNVGSIYYDCKEVVLSIYDAFGPGMIKSKPFVRERDLKDKVLDLINQRFEKYKMDHLEMLKQSKDYKKSYMSIKDRYFRSLVFDELGTMCANMRTSCSAEFQIDLFLSKLKLNHLTAILSGEMKDVDALIDTISKSEKFMEEQIVQPEVVKEAKAYVKKGVFSKREQILIDYLSKTKLSGAMTVTIQSTTGDISNYHNQVTSNGKVFSVNGADSILDIEEIKTVTYEGKVLYEKIWLQ